MQSQMCYQAAIKANRMASLSRTHVPFYRDSNINDTYILCVCYAIILMGLVYFYCFVYSLNRRVQSLYNCIYFPYHKQLWR